MAAVKKKKQAHGLAEHMDTKVSETVQKKYSYLQHTNKSPNVKIKLFSLAR